MSGASEVGGTDSSTSKGDLPSSPAPAAAESSDAEREKRKAQFEEARLKAEHSGRAEVSSIATLEAGFAKTKASIAKAKADAEAAALAAAAAAEAEKKAETERAADAESAAKLKAANDARLEAERVAADAALKAAAEAKAKAEADVAAERAAAEAKAAADAAAAKAKADADAAEAASAAEAKRKTEADAAAAAEAAAAEAKRKAEADAAAEAEAAEAAAKAAADAKAESEAAAAALAEKKKTEEAAAAAATTAAEASKPAATDADIDPDTGKPYYVEPAPRGSAKERKVMTVDSESAAPTPAAPAAAAPEPALEPIATTAVSDTTPPTSGAVSGEAISNELKSAAAPVAAAPAATAAPAEDKKTVAAANGAGVGGKTIRSASASRSKKVAPTPAVSKPIPIATMATAAADKAHPMPLAHEWTLYFDAGHTSRKVKDYWKSMVKLGNFQTVQDFWRYFNALDDHLSEDAPLLPEKFTLRLFKSHIRPVWENSWNINGGQWTMRCGLDYKKTRRLWVMMVLAAVGDTLPYAKHVNGCVLSFRAAKQELQLWVDADPSTYTVEEPPSPSTPRTGSKTPKPPATAAATDSKDGTASTAAASAATSTTAAAVASGHLDFAEVVKKQLMTQLKLDYTTPLEYSPHKATMAKSNMKSPYLRPGSTPAAATATATAAAAAKAPAIPVSSTTATATGAKPLQPKPTRPIIRPPGTSPQFGGQKSPAGGSAAAAAASIAALSVGTETGSTPPLVATAVGGSSPGGTNLPPVVELSHGAAAGGAAGAAPANGKPAKTPRQRQPKPSQELALLAANRSTSAPFSLNGPPGASPIGGATVASAKEQAALLQLTLASPILSATSTPSGDGSQSPAPPSPLGSPFSPASPMFATDPQLIRESKMVMHQLGLGIGPQTPKSGSGGSGGAGAGFGSLPPFALPTAAKSHAKSHSASHRLNPNAPAFSLTSPSNSILLTQRRRDSADIPPPVPKPATSAPASTSATVKENGPAGTAVLNGGRRPSPSLLPGQTWAATAAIGASKPEAKSKAAQPNIITRRGSGTKPARTPSGNLIPAGSGGTGSNGPSPAVSRSSSQHKSGAAGLTASGSSNSLAKMAENAAAAADDGGGWTTIERPVHTHKSPPLKSAPAPDAAAAAAEEKKRKAASHKKPPTHTTHRRASQNAVTSAALHADATATTAAAGTSDGGEHQHVWLRVPKAAPHKPAAVLPSSKKADRNKAAALAEAALRQANATAATNAKLKKPNKPLTRTEKMIRWAILILFVLFVVLMTLALRAV